MSHQNSFDMKRQRRIERRARQARSRQTIPHGGIRITRSDVKRHLYLAMHSLPHSDRAASLAAFVNVA